MPELCEKVLEVESKTQIHQFETEGVKDKMFELQTNLKSDREVLRKTMKSSQDQEVKIKDMLAKNRDIMDFRDGFQKFEGKIDTEIGELSKKFKNMHSNSTHGMKSINE